MTTRAGQFWPLMVETITAPQRAARALQKLQPQSQAIWLALCLATVLSVLVAALSQLIVPLPPELAEQAVKISPFAFAILSMAGLLMVAFTVHWTGVSLGGQGSLEDCIAAIVWLQFLLVFLNLAEILLALASPVLGGASALATMAIILWALVNFVDVVHDFSSRAKAAGVLLVSFVGVGIGIGVMLTLIGAGTAATTGGF